jgi:PAS domain S-box-containing protein
MREILEPIAHQLQSSQELDRVLAAIARDAAAHFDAPCARIWLIRRGDMCQACRWAADCQDKRRCLHLKANFGATVDPVFRRAPLDVFANESLARGGVLQWSEAIREISFLLDPAWAQERQVASVAFHPLRVENRVLGLLAIFGARPFTQADHETCMVYAATASTAIRVAELANRAQRAETTSREKTREAHQTSRLLNAVLNNSVENAIVVEDLEGNIVAFNEGARRMYGYEPSEVVGTANAERLYSPEEWASGRVMEMYRTTLEQGSFTGILQRVRKNGEPFQEQATVAALRDDDGDPAGFVIVSYEMSKVLNSSDVPADGPLTSAIEAAFSVRRVEQLPGEIVKQLCGLVGAGAGILLFLDGSALSGKAVHGEGFQANWSETRLLPMDGPELFRALENGQVVEVSAEVRNRLFETPVTAAYAVPLVRNGSLGVAVLAPEGTLGEAATATTLRFARLTASALDWTMLIDQTNEQLRHLQSSYAGLDLETRQQAERTAALERGLEQATRNAAKADRLTIENEELMARIAQLEGELFEARQAMVDSSEVELIAARISELEAGLEAAETRRSQAQTLLDEAQLHYEQAHRHLSDRNTQLEGMLADSQREIVDRDYQIHELQAGVKALNERLGKAETELAQAEEQLGAIRGEALQARGEATDAGQALNLLKSDLEESQRLFAEADEKRRIAEQSLQEREREMARVVAENEMLRETIEERATAQRMASGLEVQRLNAEVESLERRHIVREALLATVMQRLETLTRERSSWQAMLEQAEIREAEARQRLSGTTELEREIATLRQVNARQGTEVASLRQKLNLAQNAYREALNVLQSRLEDLAKLSAISGAYQKLEDALTIAAAPEVERSAAPAEADRRMVIACDDTEARKRLAQWAREIGCQAQFVENGDAMLSTLTIDPPDIVLLDLVDPEFDGLELHRRMRRNPDWRSLPVVLVVADGEIGRMGLPPSRETAVVSRGNLSPEMLRGLVAQARSAHV